METFFLACFAFGALFTLVSVVLGIAGHGVAHIGHGHDFGSHGDVGAAHGHGHFGGGHDGIGGAHGHGAAHPAATGTDSPIGSHTGSHAPHTDAGGLGLNLPLLNASSVVSALTWFGAAGYLLVKLGDLAILAALAGALIAGALGWYLVARFLGLLLAGERVMDPEDYRLEGRVGNVTIGIPAGGTGEVVFSMAGARRSEAARAAGGGPIPRGSEVVITAYADGFATVQPWGEFLAAREKIAAQEKKEA
jgi:membrane protein implicated in regulation of membrane protease activity